ncbi:hypothetical protein BDY24DRAFT_155458 [Mrakia frigida]|uniref:uncharacterized protein n=1 Tax=Mrakia frigida TaxID=29902 RepID=UPI003FCC1016
MFVSSRRKDETDLHLSFLQAAEKLREEPHYTVPSSLPYVSSASRTSLDRSDGRIHSQSHVVLFFLFFLSSTSAVTLFTDVAMALFFRIKPYIERGCITITAPKRNPTPNSRTRRNLLAGQDWWTRRLYIEQDHDAVETERGKKATMSVKRSRSQTSKRKRGEA